MIAKSLVAIAVALAFLTAPAVAQTPKKDATPPAKSAPAPAPAPAAPKAAPAVAAKVNLNTATAQELDALPQIGPARAKAIVEGRAKGKYKDWADFVARKVVPSNAEAAIKDLVSF
jgi:competence protein ComEA